MCLYLYIIGTLTKMHLYTTPTYPFRILYLSIYPRQPPFQVSPSSSSPSSTSSSASSSDDPQAPASLFSASCPLSTSTEAPHTHAFFADADRVHHATIAGLNGTAGEDKLQAAAAAATSKRGKGKGKSRNKKDGGLIPGKGTASTNKQVAQRQDKQEVREHFHAQIKSIMDLEAQEKFLNEQGRRTLRDPLDADNISPMCTLIRGCLELYEVRFRGAPVVLVST